MWKRFSSVLVIVALLCTMVACAGGGEDEWEEIVETKVVYKTVTNAQGEVVTDAQGGAVTEAITPSTDASGDVTDPTGGSQATDPNGTTASGNNGKATTTSTTQKTSATNSGNLGPKKVITFWYQNVGKDLTKILNDATKEFNNTNGKNIQAQISYKPVGGQSGYTQFDDLLIPAIAAKKGPDIIVTGLSHQDEYYQLDSYLEKYKDSDFNMDLAYPVMRESGRIDGKLIGLPFTATYGRFLVYNKSMFKQAGLDPNKPPKTIAELNTYAEKLTAEGTGNKYATVGFCPWEWYISTFSVIYEVFEGGMTDEKTGAPTPNTPENVKALEWVQSYVNKYGYSKMNDSLTAISPGGSPFQSGKLGLQMVYTGHIAGGANWSFEWGVADFPGVDGPISGDAGSDIMTVFKTCKYPEEAFLYIKTLCGLKTQTKIASLGNSMATFSPLQKANEENYDVFNPTMRAILKELVPNVPAKPAYSTPEDAKPENYGALVSEVYNKVLTAGGNPAALLKELETKVKAYIKK